MFFDYEERTIIKDWAMQGMHKHEHYELYILLEGKRNLICNNSFYKLEPFMAVLIPPLNMHKTEGGPFKRITVIFDNDFFTDKQLQYINNSITNIPFIIPPNKQFYFSSLINDFSIVSKSDLNKNYIHVQLLLYSMLYLLKSCPIANYEDNILASNINKNLSIVIHNVIEYINSNLQNNLTASSLAAKFYLSNSYLCKSFKKIFNIPISEYILNLRLNKSKQLLLNTNKKMQEISNECGFSSVNYFSLIFKRKMSISPLNYRKHLKGSFKSSIRM